MLKIKLSPIGKKHAPHYRIVIAEEHSKLTGRAVEVIGHYHPHDKSLDVDKDLLKKWLKNGAQPTDIVKELLKI